MYNKFYNSKYVRLMLIMMTLMMAGSQSALAHIMTEKSQFPDIKESEARFDVVVLVAAGIIPETPTFEPQRNFSHADLAAWGALAANLNAGKDEKPGVVELAKLGLEKGLVSSLAGDATYGEINTVLFKGAHVAEHPEAIPTRAEAARYIAAGLASPAGAAVLEGKDLHFGATGVVASVEQKTNPDGGETSYITVGDTSIPMFTHGRVGNGPSDLAKWKGLTVNRSLIRKKGDVSLWVYLESATAAGSDDEHEHDHSAHKHDDADKEPAAEHNHAEHQHEK